MRSASTERRHRVVYLVRPAEGGIKRHVLTLLGELDLQAYEPVIICSPASSMYRELIDSHFNVLPLEIPDNIAPARDMRCARELRGMIRRLQPAILHLHGAKAGLVGRMAVACMRHPRVIVTMHSFVIDERMGRRKQQLVRAAEWLFSPLADRFIAVSGALREEMVTHIGIPARKITLIYNGVAMPRVIGEAHAAPRVGTVARLAPQKGVDCFVRAAALVHQRLPEAEFVIAGDGPLRGALEALAASSGLADCLHFLGFRTDIADILAGLDVFVLSSTYEAFGLSVVEALLQRVPVVASRVGGVTEIITDGETGLLADPYNPEDFAGKILQFLEHPILSAECAARGGEMAEARFTARRMVAATEQLYRSLL